MSRIFTLSNGQEISVTRAQLNLLLLLAQPNMSLRGCWRVDSKFEYTLYRKETKLGGSYQIVNERMADHLNTAGLIVDVGGVHEHTFGLSVWAQEIVDQIEKVTFRTPAPTNGDGNPTTDDLVLVAAHAMQFGMIAELLEKNGTLADLPDLRLQVHTLGLNLGTVLLEGLKALTVTGSPEGVVVSGLLPRGLADVTDMFADQRHVGISFPQPSAEYLNDLLKTGQRVGDLKPPEQPDAE